MSKAFMLTMSIIGAFVGAVAAGVYFELRRDEASSAATKFSVTLMPEQMQDKSLVNALERLPIACPGIKDFASDLHDAKVEAFSMFYGSEAGSAAIVFKVAGSPEKIPASFRAGGHTCTFDLNGAKNQLSIAKDECKSVCAGKLANTNSNMIVML